VLVVAVVDSSPAACNMEKAEYCLRPFQVLLDKGVGELALLGDVDTAEACR